MPDISPAAVSSAANCKTICYRLVVHSIKDACLGARNQIHRSCAIHSGLLRRLRLRPRRVCSANSRGVSWCKGWPWKGSFAGWVAAVGIFNCAPCCLPLRSPHTCTARHAGGEVGGFNSRCSRSCRLQPCSGSIYCARQVRSKVRSLSCGASGAPHRTAPPLRQAALEVQHI